MKYSKSHSAFRMILARCAACATLAFFAGVPAVEAASPIGQSFTVAGSGSVSLLSISFTDLSFPYPTAPGNPFVLNVFGQDAGLATASSVDADVGYDTATPILFTSSDYSTVGNVTTFTFTGASLTAGLEYYAIFDKGGLFALNSSDTYAGGALLFGNDLRSSYVDSYDAAGFQVTTSAVPEPSTYAMIAGVLALGGTVVVRRRARRA